MASKARCVTCDDCFFRQASLCALQLAQPCPTFRPVVRGQMLAPRQAQLVPRQRELAVAERPRGRARGVPEVAVA